MLRLSLELTITKNLQAVFAIQIEPLLCYQVTAQAHESYPEPGSPLSATFLRSLAHSLSTDVLCLSSRPAMSQFDRRDV